MTIIWFWFVQNLDIPLAPINFEDQWDGWDFLTVLSNYLKESSRNWVALHAVIFFVLLFLLDQSNGPSDLRRCKSGLL